MFADITPPTAFIRFLYSFWSINSSFNSSFRSVSSSYLYSGSHGMIISNMFSLASSFLGYNVGSLRWDLWWRKNFPHGLHLNLVFFKVPSDANLKVFVVFPSTAGSFVFIIYGLASSFSLSEWITFVPVLPLKNTECELYFSFDTGLKNPLKDYCPCKIFGYAPISIFYTWVAFNSAGVKSLKDDLCGWASSPYFNLERSTTIFSSLSSSSSSWAS